MDAVIACIHGDRTAGNHHIPIAVDPVTFRTECDITAFQIKIALLIFGKNAVIARRNTDRCFFEAEAVIHMDSVRRRVDRNRTACDDKIVVCLDAMLISGVDPQGSASVDRQVIVRKNHAIASVLKRLIRQLPAAAERIRRSLRKSQKNFVRLIYTQAGIIAAGNIDTV